MEPRSSTTKGRAETEGAPACHQSQSASRSTYKNSEILHIYENIFHNFLHWQIKFFVLNLINFDNILCNYPEYIKSKVFLNNAPQLGMHLKFESKFYQI